MSTRLTLTLRNALDGYRAYKAMWPQIKNLLLNGITLGMEIFDAKTREQENLYHSCFADLARDCLYAGQKVDAEQWKRGLLQAFYDETKNDPEYSDDWKRRAPRAIPTLEGDGLIFIGVESKRFTKNLARGFITFVHATGDGRGVNWSSTSLGREWPEIVA
jgi:hypothetical protein